MASQDQYRAKAREALEKLQQQIDELKVQASLAGAEARDRFEKAIDTLRNREAETRARLDQAADATGDAWKNAAKQMEDAVDSVGDAFSTLADEIDANLRSAGTAAKAGHKAFMEEWKKQRDARERLLSD